MKSDVKEDELYDGTLASGKTSLSDIRTRGLLRTESKGE